MAAGALYYGKDGKQFVEENNIESVETLLAEADKEEFREYFMYNKVVEFMLENAQITEY